MWMRKSASLVFAAAVGSLIGLMVFSKKQPTRAEAQQTQPTVPPPDEHAQSLGSGVIISADGDILTNNHVIAPEELGGRAADQIDVQLDDKRQFRARVVARDPPTDVALLHIDAKGLTAAQLGD